LRTTTRETWSNSRVQIASKIELPLSNNHRVLEKEKHGKIDNTELKKEKILYVYIYERP
jgi:hypothetical protein